LDRAVEQGRARSGVDPVAASTPGEVGAGEVGAGAAGVGVSGVRLLPVAEPLRGLLPGGGLRGGSTVALPTGSRALLFALLAKASEEGSWCALVGLPDSGLVAAKEAGLELSRLALVPLPGPDLLAVTSVLLDGLDVVVVAGLERIPVGARRRLMARARARGAVLVSMGRLPGADVELVGTSGRWMGLGAGGAGRLSCRRIRVGASGRGAVGRRRTVAVELPGLAGAVTGSSEAVVEFGSVRARDVREVG
jgi:hypothetical protein